MSKIELKPCPFCGATDIDLIGEYWIWWVHCNGCGVETPTYDTAKKATEAWNRRADNE